MNIADPDLGKLKNHGFNWPETTVKIPISHIRGDNRYLNEFALFTGHFNYLPNYICERKIDCRHAHGWFIEEYQSTYP
ncbi:MAG: hypothetical protein U5L96_16070 [Owenweeksia sp.]|nr:hypothetical protein [Owenweeksia sp.]